ncbi:MAG: glutamate-1-semialdehyde-2,1-aminomutase [Acidobacteria bacterium]|nr:MAG: glutamate-1-semialdehyde-2,1-aminomutase [Acidobacteriota bacterium]
MNRSEQLFRRAQEIIPGGVNSPVRAFRAVGGHPLFIQRGEGSHIWDVDGREYIDYVGSWGPLIFGHRPPEVLRALQQILEIGTSFGAPTEREVDLAEFIAKFFPSVEKVRLVNSGTEATMSAIRLARGFTGRERIVKFDGCYHGHGDSLLVKAGSGVATLGLPDSPGVPQNLAGLTTVLPFNNPSALKSEFDRHGKDIACVIVEPVAGNMGCVPPRAGYLELLRDLTQRSGSILIFDEVMTGFRVARGGAQQVYGIEPDLTTLGKIIGGGLPVGAYGGRAEIMDYVAPAGPVYQAGTLSGNPLAVAAGLATLRRLDEAAPYNNLETLGSRLERGLIEAASKAGVPVRVNRVGSMFTVFFTNQDVMDFESAKTSDTQRFNRFFHMMLDEGAYLPPSQFEAAFISAAHTNSDIERTIEAASKALRKV